MPDEEEALACLMYSVYYEALGSDRWKWDELEASEKTAWLMLAQFILASFDRKQEPDHK